MPLKQLKKRVNTTHTIVYADFSGGLNYRDNASLIAPNQSPEMQNVRVRDGTIGKRPGYKKLYATSLGTGKINGLFQYKKANGTTYRLIAWGTSLYTQSGSAQPVSIKSGLANAKATFFVLNDICYMLNGTNYISYDGTTCTDVVGYIPLVRIGRSPSGSPNAGTTNEKFNLLSAGFKTSFSADGTATVYNLGYTSLDATTTSAVVNGVTKVEGTDYTVDRTAGTFTFGTAPASGTDNVVITAYKASLTHPEYIKNCTIATVYGGKTSATVFFSGNPNFPDQVWHSRLYGSNYSSDYWPDDAWQKVPGNVTGLAHIYDLLYVSHSNGHGYLSYADGTNYPIFPYSDVNLEKGSDIPGSIQEVNNSVVCASSVWGPMQILSNTTLNNRLSVAEIGNLINKGDVNRTDLGLLKQANLQNAISYNFDGYYGFCINNICYVWDYRSNAWLYDTNIPASVFTVFDATLCFGSNTDGIVYQFDPTIANDDGVAIDAWLLTKQDNGGLQDWIKVINQIVVTSKPSMRASAVISFYSRQSSGDIALTLQTSTFAYAGFNYVNFAYATGMYPVTKRKRLSKRAHEWQFKLRNNVLDEFMSVMQLEVQYDQGTIIR